MWNFANLYKSKYSEYIVSMYNIIISAWITMIFPCKLYIRPLKLILGQFRKQACWFVITITLFVPFSRGLLNSKPWVFLCILKLISQINLNNMPDHAGVNYVHVRGYIILVKLIWPIDCIYCRLWIGTQIVLSHTLWSLIKGKVFCFHNFWFFKLKNVFFLH